MSDRTFIESTAVTTAFWLDQYGGRFASIFRRCPPCMFWGQWVKLDKVREGLLPITLRFRANVRKLILGSIGTPLDHLSVKNAEIFGKLRKDPCVGTNFLSFNLISYFSNFWPKKNAKNVYFLKKKSKFWLFFLYNSKNLRLGEKTKKRS